MVFSRKIALSIEYFCSNHVVDIPADFQLVHGPDKDIAGEIYEGKSGKIFDPRIVKGTVA